MHDDDFKYLKNLFLSASKEQQEESKIHCIPFSILEKITFYHEPAKLFHLTQTNSLILRLFLKAMLRK